MSASFVVFIFCFPFQIVGFQMQISDSKIELVQYYMPYTK